MNSSRREAYLNVVQDEHDRKLLDELLTFGSMVFSSERWYGSRCERLLSALNLPSERDARGTKEGLCILRVTSWSQVSSPEQFASRLRQRSPGSFSLSFPIDQVNPELIDALTNEQEELTMPAQRHYDHAKLIEHAKTRLKELEASVEEYNQKRIDHYSDQIEKLTADPAHQVEEFFARSQKGWETAHEELKNELYRIERLRTFIMELELVDSTKELTLSSQELKLLGL